MNILKILKRLEKLAMSGKTVKINWYYEEDDQLLKEIGEDFATVVDVPFHVLLIEEV